MATKTIGASGADYTTIAAWSAAVKAIGTLTEDETGHLIDDADYAYGARNDLNFSGVNRAGFTITLEATTNKHNGDFGNGARVEVSVFSGGVYNVDDMTVNDFSVRNTTTSSNGARGFTSISDSFLNRVISKCDSSGSNTEPFKTSSAGGGSTLISCRGVGGTTGMSLTDNLDNLTNCTVVDAVNGIVVTAGHLGTIKNTAVFNCSTDWAGTYSGTYSNNASEDGTHPGTSGVTLSGSPFNGDGYTPKLSGQLDGAGVNLSITLDATNRPFDATPSIGAYELAENLLNTLTVVPDGAFSLSRYLEAGFEGADKSVVRLREDNLDTEQDFKLNGSNVLVTDDGSEDTVATWLTANSATGAFIVTWYNQAAGGIDYVQATLANQPTLNESGMNSLAAFEIFRLDPSFLESASSYDMANTNGGFICAAFEVNDDRAQPSYILSDPNSSTFYVAGADSLGGWTYFADTGQEATAGTTTVNEPNIITAQFPSGGNPKACIMRDDGTEIINSSFNMDIRSGTYRMGRAGASNVTDSTFAEMIFDNTDFSDSDRDLVESSLATQFGITLPSIGNPWYYYAQQN